MRKGDSMKFTKMHGIGNCYLYFNCFEDPVLNPAELSVRLSDVHFGVGSDGIILIEPSEIADCKMDIYNADGSRGKMCGNGIRCVGKYVYDRGLVKKDVITVETLSGIKTLYLNIEGGAVKTVRVDMGRPILTPAEIPVRLPGDKIVNKRVKIENERAAKPIHAHITCVSMGNPHCVVFEDFLDVGKFPLEDFGPKFERDPLFPEGVNTEFVNVINDHEVKMRVWERGSGETWACGTGACAVAVACVLNGRTGRRVLVHLRGGDLEIEWDERADTVWMTGPAAFVCDCECNPKEFGQ